MKNWRELIRRAGPLRLFSVALILVLIVITGLATSGVLKGGFDFGSRAWTGFSANLAGLTKQASQSGQNASNFSYSMESYQKTKKLFDDLSHTYYNAEVQNITIPQFNIIGAAFLKYDETLDKTFIFTSIENFPVPNNQIIRLWITRDGQVYLPVGVMDFMVSNNRFYGYSVFVRPGDIRNYKELVFSYDPVVKINKPSRVVLSVQF